MFKYVLLSKRDTALRDEPVKTKFCFFFYVYGYVYEEIELSIDVNHVFFLHIFFFYKTNKKTRAKIDEFFYFY